MAHPRHMRTDADWVKALLDRIEPDPGLVPTDITDDPFKGAGGGPTYSQVRGGVPTHNDQHYPRWSYLLVLKAEGAVLKSAGHDPLPLDDLSIVELELWTNHSLDQPTGSRMYWVPLDCEERLSLEEALEEHRLNIENEIAPDPYFGNSFRSEGHAIVCRPHKIAFVSDEDGIVFELTENALTGREYNFHGINVFDGTEIRFDNDDVAFADAWSAVERVMEAIDLPVRSTRQMMPLWLVNRVKRLDDIAPAPTL